MEALLYAGLIMLAIIVIGGVVALLWLHDLDKTLRELEEVV